ncbi:hypothetical protein QYF36_005517 [Acer negundo]|nr:hypothetical protein QYF36_005517 [Acer negundo]
MEGLSFLSIIRCFIFYLSIELSLATLTINPRRFIGDGETFVSLSERFELGFFSPGNSKSRYLGIWHKECPGTVVWVANRNNPILDRRGVLCIGNYGNFILLNRTKDIIWSSDKSSRKIKNPVVHFLETGNLVLGESSFLISCKSYLWQSFDYPSDTLLPGMKLGRDLKTNPERYLMSWKSADDPSSGDFIFKLDIHVLPQISVYNGSMKISRSGLWNGVSFGGIPTITTSLLRQHLVHNEDEFYYMYEIDIPVIIKLNQAGEMQCLICSSGWDIMYTVPFDSCGIKLLKDVEGQDIYVRVPASEIGLEELQDTLFLVLSVILGMLMVFLSFCIAWKITKNGGNGHLITGQGSRKEDIEIPLFDLSTIATATNNFSQDNFIGAGGFGPVYKLSEDRFEQFWGLYALFCDFCCVAAFVVFLCCFCCCFVLCGAAVPCCVLGLALLPVWPFWPV